MVLAKARGSRLSPLTMLACLLLGASLAWPTMDEPATHRGGRDPSEKGTLTAKAEPMENDTLTASTFRAQRLVGNVQVPSVSDYKQTSKTESSIATDPHTVYGSLRVDYQYSRIKPAVAHLGDLQLVAKRGQ